MRNVLPPVPLFKNSPLLQPQQVYVDARMSNVTDAQRTSSVVSSSGLPPMHQQSSSVSEYQQLTANFGTAAAAFRMSPLGLEFDRASTARASSASPLIEMSDVDEDEAEMDPAKAAAASAAAAEEEERKELELPAPSAHTLHTDQLWRSARVVGPM